MFYRLGLNVREIQLRSRGLTLLQSFAVLGWSLLSTTFSALNFIGYPCFLHWWGLNFCAVLIGYTLNARALRYVYLIHFNHAKTRADLGAAHSPDHQVLHVATDSTNHRAAIGPKPLNEKGHRFQVDVLHHSAFGKSRSVPGKTTGSRPGSLPTPMRGFLGPWIGRHARFFQNDQGFYRLLLGFLAVFFIYVLLIQILSPRFSLSPVALECHFSWEYYPTFVWIGAHVVVTYPIIVYHLWGLSDPYGICRDLLTVSLSVTAGSIMFFLWALTPNHVNRLVSRLLWVFLAVNIVHTSSVTLPVYRALRAQRQRRHRRREHRMAAQRMGELEFGTDSNLADSRGLARELEAALDRSSTYDGFNASFIKLLNEPSGLLQLRTWASECFCVELIFFLQEYQELKIFLDGAFPLVDPAAATASLVREVHLTKFERLSNVALNGPRPSQDSATWNSAVKPLPPAHLGSNQPLLRIEGNPLLPCITSSIRETWELLDDDMTTDVICAEYPVADRPALRLAYIMFYQRFLDPTSDLCVNVSLRLRQDIDRDIQTGRFPITIFDDVHHDVMMLLYTEVFLKFYPI
ncbi:hypothetical protein IWQ60_007964 [Tieghemiomyces parasiticus]|uniref:RGS domain-containing protein n=1 Tax=Tieghemiomyces parasiticus TaxID=78921 RepID=A0A9W8DSI1_9FUNG|nr:hypothetical protein IWQ60_007964 [Tieghemiomyces parasiticus]